MYILYNQYILHINIYYHIYINYQLLIYKYNITDIVQSLLKLVLYVILIFIGEN